MDHPECYAELVRARRAGETPATWCLKTGRKPRVSSEDAEARADAMKNLGGGVPMALEKAEQESPLQAENPEIPGLPSPCCTSEACTLNVHMRRWECETHGFSDGTKPKRRRRTPEEIEADKLAKAQEREAKKAETARKREEAKAARARERAEAKIAAKREKIAEAEGGTVELPAVVLRNGTVRHVSDADAWAVCEMYLDDLCLDVETSGYPLGHRLYELRTVQLGGEHAAVVFDASDSYQMQIASLALTLAKKLRAHSATADVIPCVHAGLIGWEAAWAKMQDSVLNAKLTDPKMSGSDADALKELSADLLREYAVSPEAEKAKNELFKEMGCLVKTDLNTPPEKNGWYSVNRYSVVMTRYAGSDVLDLAAVLRVLPPIPVPEAVMDREREFQAACAPVTHVGFALDHDHIKKKIAEEETARDEAQKAVEILSDGKITNPKSTDVLKFLPEVIPGLVLPIHRKTKNPTADKGALEGLCRDYKDDPLAYHLLKQILAYRHHDTTLGLLLRPLNELCEQGDGRMRPTVYTIEASTGRTSCRRPNGQQFSRQGGVRACVRADDGYRGISADFEGCEIRVAAALSGDRGLLDAETSGRCYLHDAVDCCEKPHTGLHWMAAHAAFGKDATKEHRYWCKRGIFCKLFGGGPDTAASQVYCDVASMQAVFGAFEELAPVYTAWDRWLRMCYKEGSLVWRDYSRPMVPLDPDYYAALRPGTFEAETYRQNCNGNYSQPIDGQNRMIYRAYSDRNIYISNGQHAAGNGAIQGTARELLVDGTLNWRRTQWGSYPLLPVHDQIIAFVPEIQAADATVALKTAMATDVLSSPGFEVHIGADVDEPFVSWPDSS